jgi:predicted DsbA family dithiol-disulfide isomerase
VNVLAPPKARLSVEIVYDLICPWCYLGVRRLLRTFRRRPDLLFDLIWRPFLLNPDMPRAGMARPDYVIRKFGGEERAKRLYASITDLGRREGVGFAFERIRRTPSSIDAHRLVRYAARYGRADALVESLFSVHFTEGYDIGDHAVLVAIASACGLDPAETKAFLATDEEADTVHADNLRAHRLGINGVPCFVIGGRHAIAGAQEPEVIERLLDVAAVDAAEL